MEPFRKLIIVRNIHRWIWIKEYCMPSCSHTHVAHGGAATNSEPGLIFRTSVKTRIKGMDQPRNPFPLILRTPLETIVGNST